MPFTPYTGTIGFEYKPLGLEQFAAPLAKMQEGYDSAQQKIDAMDFDINALSVDDETKKKILDEFHTRKNELANELMTSKNYREAARKVMNLNQLYQKDVVLQGMQSNYKAFNDWDKEQKDRVKSGKLTQSEYETNRNVALARYKYDKGVGYAPGKGDGNLNLIQLNTLSDNLEEDIMKIAKEFANMTPEQREYTAKSLRFEPKYLQLVTEASEKHFIDKDWISKELFNAIATSDRYKEFYRDRAELELDAHKYGLLNENESKYQNHLREQYTSQVDDLNSRISEISRLAKKGDKKYIEFVNSGGLEGMVKQRDQLKGILSEDTVSDSLYRSRYVDNYTKNKIKSLADAVSDLKDYKYYDLQRDYENASESLLKQMGYGDQTEETTHSEASPSNYTQDLTFDSLRKTIGDNVNSGKSALDALNKATGNYFGKVYKYGHGKGEHNLYDQEKQANALLHAVSKSGGNYNKFVTEFKKLGGVDKGHLYNMYHHLVKDENSTNNIKAFRENLYALKNSNSDLRISQDIWDKTDDAVKNDANFKAVMSNIGNVASGYELGQMYSEHSSDPALKKLYQTGNRSMPITLDQYAKAAGFKDAKTALEKGYKFPEGYFMKVTADLLGNKNNIDEKLTNIFGNNVNQAYSLLKDATREEHLDKQLYGSTFNITGNTKADKELLANTNAIVDAHVGVNGENLGTFQVLVKPKNLNDKEEEGTWVKAGPAKLNVLQNGRITYAVPVKNSKSGRITTQLVIPKTGSQQEGKLSEIVTTAAKSMNANDPQREIYTKALFRDQNPVKGYSDHEISDMVVYKNDPAIVEEFNVKGIPARIVKKSDAVKGHKGKNYMYYTIEYYDPTHGWGSINAKDSDKEFKSSDYEKVLSEAGSLYLGE